MPEFSSSSMQHLRLRVALHCGWVHTQALLLSARLLPGDDEAMAVIAGRQVEQALQRLSLHGKLQTSLLDLRGKLLATTSDELWQAVSPQISPGSKHISSKP